ASAAIACWPRAWPGQTSGCLSATKSVAGMKPCSRLSMPRSAASAYVTEQRCPVTFMRRACAASMAAFSAAREICMYALTDVAPWPAQYATCERASCGVFTACSCRKVFGPLTYGAVASMSGPGNSQSAMRRARLMSKMPCMLPPVLIVFTQPAGYRRVKLAPRRHDKTGPDGELGDLCDLSIIGDNADA